MDAVAVNLIPIRRLRLRRRAGRMHRWAAVASGYAALWLAAFAATRLVSAADDRELTEGLARMQGLGDRARATVAGLESELREAKAGLEASLAVGRQPDWSVLLALLAEVLGDEVVLRSVRLEPLAAEAGRSGAAAGAIRVELSGIARTHHAATRFVLRLDSIPLFIGLKLTDTRSEPFLEDQAIAFRILGTIDAGARGVP